MSNVKPWSISTTVRNPARLRDFLQVLADLAGKPFDASAQREYQIRLIQNWIGIEKDRVYYEAALNRLRAVQAKMLLETRDEYSTD